jgi:uncharacterized protein YcbX
VSATVTALTTTPVKGLRVLTPSELQVGADGASDDRRFYLVDDRGWMVNGKRLGALSTVVPEYYDGALALTFSGGEVVRGEVQLGERIDTRFYSRPAQATVVRGPWSTALSELVGEDVRIVEAAGRSGIDRGRAGAVSLISQASLAGLAAVAGSEGIDARRFRMTVEIDGVDAHGEDGWIGERVRVGGALVRFGGHVGRCLITSRDPETGVVDLPTLDLLRSYRGGLDTTEPLPFGIYGEVLEAGTVAVGDRVELA